MTMGLLQTQDSLLWASDDLDLFLTYAKGASTLAIDTETTGLGPENDIRDGRGYAQGLSLAFAGPTSQPLSGYFPFRHVNGSNLEKSVLFKLAEVIENHPRVVFHNAKYDIVSLASLGINVIGEFWDTMLMAHMLNENLYSKELDYLAKHYCHNEGKQKSANFQVAQALGWLNIPSHIMADYAANDTVITLELYEFLRPLFDAEFEYELWEYEQQFIRLIIKMESRGVAIDVPLAERQAAIGRFLMGDIYEYLGFNPGSSKQVGEYLVDHMQLPVVKRTPAGKPSFDKFAMEEYEAILARMDNDHAQQILKYRGWQKAVTSNYEPYVNLLSPDGRLRPHYNLHRTVTGRLSCSSPNLQQIPRTTDKEHNGAMKECFIPREGYTLIEADYAQLELRLAAAYAKETNLLEVFADPSRDVFTEMSEQLGMSRFDTKTLTYSIQYGAGATRIRNVFGVTIDEAQAIKDNYYARFPGFAAITKLASAKCRQQRFLRLWTGRRRHFQYPADEAHKAFNSIIQGGAAEIVKRTMLRLEQEIDSDDCRMLLQVHDSVVFEVRTERVDEYSKRIIDCMSTVPEEFGVTFAVDCHIWGEG